MSTASEAKILWEDELLSMLTPQLGDDPASRSVQGAIAGSRDIRIHLAIFREPFLSYVFQGRKTIESRFSMTKQPPYNVVRPGDVIILKESAAAIRGLCTVAAVWFYELSPDAWTEIDRHSAALCMDSSEFWREKRHSASFATLMVIRNVKEVVPFTIRKADPRGWVTLGSSECLQETLPFV